LTYSGINELLPQTKKEFGAAMSDDVFMQQNLRKML